MAKPCLRTSHGVMSVSGCHERAHARTARSSVANGDAPLEHQGHGREQAALSLPPFPVKVCFHVSQPVAQQQGLVTRLHAHPILMSLIAACQHGRCARAQWKSTRARALYHCRVPREAQARGRATGPGGRARARTEPVDLRDDSHPQVYGGWFAQVGRHGRARALARHAPRRELRVQPGNQFVLRGILALAPAPRQVHVVTRHRFSEIAKHELESLVEHVGRVCHVVGQHLNSARHLNCMARLRAARG